MATPNKQRKSDIADVFFEFRRNPGKRSRLNAAHTALLEGLSGMNLRALRVKESNARSCTSFANAHCDTEAYGGLENSFTVGSVFSYGLHVIKKYVSCEKVKIPRKCQDASTREALRKLLDFISPDIVPTELTMVTSETEADLTVRLAQHLFLKLAVSSSYTIDSQHMAENPGKCPCQAQEPLQGTFGDTSFGCSEGWHGSPDIILDLLTVKLGTFGTLEDSKKAGDSSVVVKSSDDFVKNDLQQMKAQTIVFSFLQKSKGEELSNHLIPCIGISKQKLLIHFYDCVNDILLSSGQLELYADMGNNTIDFNYPVILFLWLTLNYRLFCSGPTEPMKEFKSTFFQHVEQSLQMYETEVTRPCRVTYEKCEETGSWTNRPGEQGPHKEDKDIDYDEFTDEEDQDSV